MTRKTFDQIRAEQRAKDIDEIVLRLQLMGLSDVATKVKDAMTGDCYRKWPYLDETRHSLDG